jgi:delta-1-pyrroline-5-carboxylate synthetase
MSLYETMFNQFDITVSQLLLTSFDFTSPERRRNVQHVISQLLALGIVPLLNENDAVSANQGYETFGMTFSDNDSLASLVAVEMSAQLLILLTDVPGVFDRPPTEPEARIIDVYQESVGFTVGSKSLQGRGGMGAKVAAALSAVKGGVQAVVIAAGHNSGVIGHILEGAQVGTLFLQNAPCVEESTKQSERGQQQQRALLHMAAAAREQGRALAAASSATRDCILLALAEKLENNTDELLRANLQDLVEAEKRSALPHATP